MQEIFDYSIFGNTVFSYLSALGIFTGGMAVVYVFGKYILNRLKDGLAQDAIGVFEPEEAILEPALMGQEILGIVERQRDR